MKKKLFVLPLLALLLGACAPETSVSVPSSTETNLITETSMGGTSASSTTAVEGGGSHTSTETKTSETTGSEEEQEQGPTITGITISPESATLTLGETKQFSATLTPSDATGEIKWEIVELDEKKSDEEPRVIVSETGEVKVLKFAKTGTGHYQVKATCGTVSDTASLTINDFNYGSLNEPITTQDALNIIDYHPYESDGPIAYIKAFVSSNTIKNEDGQLNANVAYQEDGEAIYIRKATVKDGLTAGETVNDLSGKEILIQTKVREEQNTKKKEFHYGEIIAINEPTPTETPTKLVVSSNKITVVTEEPRLIHAYMLPMPAIGNITWSIAPEVEGLTVENGLISATSAVPDNTEAIITASIADTEIKQEIALTIVNKNRYGTLQEPLSPASAAALIPATGLSEADLFVKGKITELNRSGSSTTYNGYLTSDTAREFRFEKLDLKSSNQEEVRQKYVGREIIITGKGEIIEALPGMKSPTLALLIPLPKAESFTLDHEAATLYLNDTLQVKATFPEGTEGSVTWTSDKPSEVTVENGLITVLETAQSGDVIITVSLDGTEFTKKITITVVATVMTIASFDCTIKPANFISKMQFEATLTNAKFTTDNGTNSNAFSWYSGNVRAYKGNKLTITPLPGHIISKIEFVTTKGTNWIDTIDNGTASFADGILTIVPSNGSNPINATIKETMNIETITVYSIPAASAEEFNIPTTLQVYEGGSKEIGTTFEPAGSFNTIEWVISDQSKASIENDVISLTENANAGDEFIITGTLKGTSVTHTCTVSVIEAPSSFTHTFTVNGNPEGISDGTKIGEVMIGNTKLTSSETKWYTDELRVYKNAIVNFEAVSGYKIISIKVFVDLPNEFTAHENCEITKGDKFFILTPVDGEAIVKTKRTGTVAHVSKIEIVSELVIN